MKNRRRILYDAAAAIAVLGGSGFILRKQLWSLKNDHLPGNGTQYRPDQAAVNPESPLKGKTFLFLGSSVTKGECAKSVSFVEYLERIDGITGVKEAVSGTTLADENGQSYIPRMKTMDPTIRADLFVCQLSTNDATKRKPLGAVSESFDMNTFDTKTVAGAMEYIIAYARKTWHCPVVFYTGTKYESEAYETMVELLKEIQKKWDIGVIDLWNDPQMNAVSKEDYTLYMADPIHPTQAGYLLWWTPKFEAFLSDYLKN